MDNTSTPQPPFPPKHIQASLGLIALSSACIMGLAIYFRLLPIFVLGALILGPSLRLAFAMLPSSEAVGQTQAFAGQDER